MRMYDLIKKKRDGGELTESEINFFINGYTKGEIPDYQASALSMAIYLKGMSEDETALLTYAIRDSGDRLDFSKINGIRADKHSTGGVGDKTSLVVAPLVASLGLKVAKMSGRGLGHTGGTIDKLESIPGFCTELTEKEFIECVNKVGVAIVGQNKNLAPADKKMYALRDVTATVDSIPLIVSSIMGKKLVADDDIIVLDVKMGSGAFAKTKETALSLAQNMVNIGKRAGKKTIALITDMDRPLGTSIGNALEVEEALETLRGNGEKDFTVLCKELAVNMLILANYGTRNECFVLIEEALASGKALRKFEEMVKAQGGDLSRLSEDKYRYLTKEIKANKSGYITKVNTEAYGTASLILGSGRNTLEEKIDYGAGIVLKKKTGDYVAEEDVIAVFYSLDAEKIIRAEEVFLSATEISNEKPEIRELILMRVE